MMIQKVTAGQVYTTPEIQSRQAEFLKVFEAFGSEMAGNPEELVNAYSDIMAVAGYSENNPSQHEYSAPQGNADSSRTPENTTVDAESADDPGILVTPLWDNRQDVIHAKEQPEPETIVVPKPDNQVEVSMDGETVEETITLPIWDNQIDDDPPLQASVPVNSTPDQVKDNYLKMAQYQADLIQDQFLKSIV